MSETEVISILRDALGVAVAMAYPLLLAALVMGVVVGLLQALTSIQDMTLTFVPKIVVMLIVFWVSASVMGRSVVDFWDREVLAIVSS